MRRSFQINPADDSRYVVLPTQTALNRHMPMGIETCAGCSQMGDEALPPATTTTPPTATERPWWFWLAVGGGIGAALYLVNKSGILSNPNGRKSDFQLAQEAAALGVQAGIPTILWGAPGIGKTSWLEALVSVMRDEKGRPAKAFTVIGSTKDPADIGGMMKLDGSLMAPSWAREIQERSMAGMRSVLFLDEFSSMTPLVHAALLRVVRDKIAGECDLDPKNGPLRGAAVHVVCAANPVSEGAASIDLPPPAANRMIHIDWPVPSGLSYGLGLVLGWPIPKIPALPINWRETEEAKMARKDISFFVQRREGLLLDFPKQHTERGRAWPSPRSWEMAADILGAARAAGVSEDVQAILVRGSVGSGAGGEFLNWLVDRSLPDPEQLLKDPTIWDPPKDRSDILWAAADSIVLAVAAKPTPERLTGAWNFVEYVIDKTKAADAMKIPFDDLMRIKRETPELQKMMPTKEQASKFYPLFRKAKILAPAQQYITSQGTVKIGPSKKK